MVISPNEVLEKYWGYSSFRGVQLDIINSVLRGKDTLALLPTGGGKSICFQVPAMIMDGLCLVVSPLIALMKDQVENLSKKGIPALAIHSGMSWYEVRQALQSATTGDYKFLYLSPERLQTNLFHEYLPALPISLLAIDEAHCISQWGYDFRPPYLQIAELREHLGKVPVLALSASATVSVQKDIVKKLRFKDDNVFRQSFERQNISYSCFKVDSKLNKLVEILTNVPGSSIVYCKNRRQTKNIADLLKLQNIQADFYHAGLASDERNRKQEEWINNKTRVIVSTNAFGMGIDKPNVRSVVHYDLPDCVESYYQEAGRAGRDGSKAYAVALYHHNDVEELKQLPEIRFPSIPEIRKVYQALADYLQIPVGLGEGVYYDFDIMEFSKNFKLDLQLVINALKALEQEGYLSFNENIFLPSKVMFIASKELMEEFGVSHPELEAVMKCLLRTYEGIYENRISINERLIAKLCRIPLDVVKDHLLKLVAFSIIEYLPQKDTPQVYFVYNRASAPHLEINSERYLLRKKQYTERVSEMLNYLEHTSCRSEFIGKYFGDPAISKCGVCDNCLKDKSSALTTEEFSRIENDIYASIPVAGIDVKELMPLLKAYNKQKVWKVLDFLQSERKVVTNEKGCLFRQPH